MGHNKPRSWRVKSAAVDLSAWGVDPLGISRAFSEAITATLEETPPEIYLPSTYCSEGNPLEIGILVPLGAHCDDHPEWRTDLRHLFADCIDAHKGLRVSHVVGDGIDVIQSLVTALREEADKLEAALPRDTGGNPQAIDAKHESAVAKPCANKTVGGS